MSFKITRTPDGLEIVSAPPFNSHAEIPGDGYEAEWTDSGLTVRIRDDESETVRERLEEFVVGKVHNITGLLRYLVAQNPALTWLKCQGCTSLTSLPDMPALTELDCRGCTSLTSLPDMPALTWLNCQGCTGLTSLPKRAGLRIYK